MQTTTTKRTGLHLAAANANAALALHKREAYWEARRAAHCKSRAELGIDIGGSPFVSADIVSHWANSPHPVKFGFAALRHEALDECEWLATGEMMPGGNTHKMFEEWKVLARRKDIPPEIAELFAKAGLL